MLGTGAALAGGAAAAGGGFCNTRVIVWFRRDLRLADNPALVAALRMAPEVLPVYIWSPEEEGQFQPGRCSRWWLRHSLAALERDLAALGSRLLCYRAPDSGAALAGLAAQVGAGAVLFNHLYDPISLVRDNEVKAGLSAAGIFCQSFNADILREPWEVMDASGKPFTCYDGFWAAHCGLPYPPSPPLPLPAALPPVAPEIVGTPLAQLGIMSAEEEMSNAQLEYHWQPGSAGAHRLLDEFVRGGRLRSFDKDRAKTDRASTSRLSPHIHYGEISVRHIHYVAKHQELEWAREGQASTSVQDFLRQLGYREYSRYLSFHFPFTHERSLLEHLRAVPWRFDQRLFKAWRQGRTGYPLVDAAMREVWGTGWMHNRMRVVAASFMVKNLLLPWQWGLKHYWDALLDADLECDALGWQYVAGCMADAHEFSYMINHATEAKRFDPEGQYVRRWLPVLARLPSKYIHQPWAAPESVLEDAGVELGVNYPWPVISEEESEAALRAADAVVHACVRPGGSAAPAPAVGVPGSGPYRPATDAEPAEAERLFAEHYRNSLAGTGTAPLNDRVEGYGGTEDVQSNIAGPADDCVSYAPAVAELAPAAAAALAGRQWEGSPSGTATGAATTGAASAAPPMPQQLPTGRQRAAAASMATVGGSVTAPAAAPLQQPAEQPQQQPQQPQQPEQMEEQTAAVLQLAQPALVVQHWEQPGSCPAGAGGSGGGSGFPGSAEGTGHATMTGVSAHGVVPSLRDESGGQVPQASPPGALPRPPRPQQQQQGQQQQATNEAQHQGSNSPTATNPGGSSCADQQAQWPPEQRAGGKRARPASPPLS